MDVDIARLAQPSPVPVRPSPPTSLGPGGDAPTRIPAPKAPTRLDPWVHAAGRPHFLPPDPTPASALNLINDSLEVVRDYREFVDTVGRLEAEFGRGLAAAVKKFEGRLDTVLLPSPGAPRKPPPPGLTNAIRVHCSHLSTAAALHQKREGALASQISQPLTNLERRGAESARRLGAWGRDVRSRWEVGRDRVDTAKVKYHAALKEHEAALFRLRSAPKPGDGARDGSGATSADKDWAKLERTAAETEATRADRKRAYVVALAGEGGAGGGGWDLGEGGGESGWGEEARLLFGHIEQTLLDLLLHQAREDKAHIDLVSNVLARAEPSYDVVDIVEDENKFLAWNTTRLERVESGSTIMTTGSARRAARRLNSFNSLNGGNGIANGATSPASPAGGSSGISSSGNMTSMYSMSSIDENGNDSTNGTSNGTSTNGSATIDPTTTMTPPSAETSLLFSDEPTIISPDYSTANPTFAYHVFAPPPAAPDETPALSTDKRVDRNWLVNRWARSASDLRDLAGEDGTSGKLGNLRRDLATVRSRCEELSAARGLGDPEEMWEKRLAVIRDIGPLERKAAVARAEMACLEGVLGPAPAPELPHEFKDRQFPKPAPCDACGQSVWSLKHELSCRLCGIALHHKCSLHVDPECTGLKSTRRKTLNGPAGLLRRSMTHNPLRRRSMMNPHGGPQEYRPDKDRLEPLRDDELQVSPFVLADEEDRTAVAAALDMVPQPNVMLAHVHYSYPAADDQELGVLGGEVVRVLEPDLDGTGWIRVRRGLDAGDEGLVPQSYLGLVGTTTPPADGGAGAFIVALFNFPPPTHALGRGEVAITQHAVYELTAEGMAFDENWCELLVPQPSGGAIRKRGLVPKTYVKQLGS